MWPMKLKTTKEYFPPLKWLCRGLDSIRWWLFHLLLGDNSCIVGFNLASQGDTTINEAALFGAKIKSGLFISKCNIWGALNSPSRPGCLALDYISAVNTEEADKLVQQDKELLAELQKTMPDMSFVSSTYCCGDYRKVTWVRKQQGGVLCLHNKEITQENPTAYLAELIIGREKHYTAGESNES